MKFEIINKDLRKWSEIIKEADEYDFHHTRYFHQIDTDYECKLLYFYNDDSFIALPVVIRPVTGTSFFDITSVYGYSGPVYSFKNGSDRSNLIDFFKNKFEEYCLSNNIVSVFSRLHPLIDQNFILKDLGKIENLNKTVSLDLTLPPEEQWRGYRKSMKPEINKMRREGVQVKEAVTEEEVDAFVDIYYETMDKVNASESYYFSRKYFHSFISNSDFEAKILLAIYNDEIIAGAIFTFTASIMQYHLAGTKSEYVRMAPMKLILDEARLIGNQASAKNLHLGGGVGGHDDDSLFRFKSGFSKNFKQFSIWKYIVNEDVYRNLSKDKESSAFFPLYRS